MNDLDFAEPALEEEAPQACSTRLALILWVAGLVGSAAFIAGGLGPLLSAG